MDSARFTRSLRTRGARKTPVRRPDPVCLGPKRNTDRDFRRFERSRKRSYISESLLRILPFFLWLLFAFDFKGVLRGLLQDLSRLSSRASCARPCGQTFGLCNRAFMARLSNSRFAVALRPSLTRDFSIPPRRKLKKAPGQKPGSLF